MTNTIEERLDFSSYLSVDAISSTGLRLLRRSPAHFKARVQEDPTRAQELGTLVHMLILEPDRFRQSVAVGPDVSRATKTWKEFEAGAEGRTLLKRQDYDQISAMADSVMANKAARTLIEKGLKEVSFFWEDADTKMKCKARPDLISMGSLADIKTTSNAHPLAFPRQVANLGYWIQAAFYMMGHLAVYDFPAEEFFFVAVENYAPYVCGVYRASSEMISRGKDEVARLLGIYEDCERSGEWPGYGSNYNYTITIDLPRWAE
ncbi:MAG: PD-(D/E)XK nuclease-like domain-containing protein [Magnetococcus sp. THC-1_WYH]